MRKYIIEHYPKITIALSHISNYVNRKRVNAKLKEVSSSLMYLSLEDLETMNPLFPKAPAYKYDLESLKRRGQIRSKQLHELTKSYTNLTETLELGAMDGIVSYYLSKDYNKICTCFDLEPKPIDLLSDQKTKFIKGDINKLPFQDNSFNLAFSFNAFEHFHDPKTALLEILRVTKPGGFIYLDFGPLYYAPKGLHWYRSINIPYCQILFEYNTLEDYCKKHNLNIPVYAIENGLNGWNIGQYRELWHEMKSFAKIKQYYEYPMYAHLNLVEELPQYFKGKFNHVDDLITNRIQILFQVN